MKRSLVKRFVATVTVAAWPFMGVIAQSDLSTMVVPVITPPPAMTNNGLLGSYEEKAAPVRLAKVLVYRPLSSSVKSQEGAIVYLDGDLQTALRPGGYTEFCVSPGRHVVYSTWGEKEYRGPESLKNAMLYEAGQTYYYEHYNDQNANRLKMVAKSQADQVLPKTQKQVHLQSRAASALTCN